jgi:hypothetical protein
MPQRPVAHAGAAATQVTTDAAPSSALMSRVSVLAGHLRTVVNELPPVPKLPPMLVSSNPTLANGLLMLPG